MEDPSQSMIFKILNGPQNGVEVALEVGEYSIGNDRDDDLQIIDVGLSGKHGRLRIADGRISISAGSGSISTSTGLVLNAGEVAWHDIDQLDVVSIGTTRFAVGKASANWAGLLASSSANSTTEKAVRAESRSPIKSGRLVRFGLPAVALVVLATFLTIALSGPQGSISNLIRRNSVSDVEVVRDVIAKLPFGSQVKVSEEVDGSIFASGYVESLVQRRAVNDAVAATGVQVRMRLWARDVVRNEVASLIEVRQLPLTFDLTKDGQIVLKGRELHKVKVEELSALISQQVVGVSGVRSQVETAENVLENVRELARRVKVGEGVLFRLAPLDGGGQLIEATGAIRNDQIDAWLGFLKSYAATIADFMALRSYVGIEGQKVIINNINSATQDSVKTVEKKDNAPEVVPLILASDKTAPDTVAGRRVPLDMFLNNQTSYEKLLDAVAPSAIKTDLIKTNVVKADLAKLEPVKKSTANTQDKSADVTTDIATDKDLDARKTPTDTKTKSTISSDTSLMQALGITTPVDILSDDDDATIVVPQIVKLPKTTDNVADSVQANQSLKEATDDTSASEIAATTETAIDMPQIVKLPKTTDNAADTVQANQSLKEATDDTSASEISATTEKKIDVPQIVRLSNTTKETQETIKRVPDKVNKSVTTTEIVTPPVLDIAQSKLAQEDNKAARQLQDATTAILKLNNSARLNDLLGVERGKDVQQALNRISRTVKQAAAVRPLIAQKAGPQNASACWEGSNITPDVLPTLIFWLDLLSISEKVSIDDLFTENYGLLLEAGLSPDRIRDCLLRQNDPAMAKLATSSIYLEEVARNPDFIRFLLRSSSTFDLALAGANTIGARYVQLDNGDKLTEGEAPSLDSRIASIGDLGILVRVPNGYVAEVYPKSMPWMIR